MKLRTAAILLVGIILLVSLFFISIYSLPKDAKNITPGSLSEAEKTALEAAVVAAIDQKTSGYWDKKITTYKIHPSNQAVAGVWAKKDYWPWIAWQDNQGNWDIKVAFDGFDCQDLAQIPTEYETFFKEFTIAPNGKPYCYDHP
jgi:hypothetical protein